MQEIKRLHFTPPAFFRVLFHLMSKRNPLSCRECRVCTYRHEKTVCRDVEICQHISRSGWSERYRKNYRRTSRRFPLQLSFGMTMGVFISGRSLEQERTLNMIDTWAWVEKHEHLILYDVLETCFPKQVRDFKESSIWDNNLNNEPLCLCLLTVHVRLLSAPLFTNFPSLFATFRYQSRTSAPALASQSFCKAINQTRALRSQIYNFHSRCVCLCALVESLCDCSRVQ